MRSLRIDRAYRAIILKPAEGNVHMLLWADKHDNAYSWATRHRCSINSETGALQVYEPRQAAPPVMETAATAEPAIFGKPQAQTFAAHGRPCRHGGGSPRYS